jgi:ribosome-associated toxin RatA of RatAB toxin-antitoxin module
MIFFPILFFRLLSFASISFIITLLFSAIALERGINPANASPKVSSQISYQMAASSDDIVVSGEKGKYVARILVNSSKENVWKILTDYTKLSRFMPELVSSKMVKNNGNQKILDQIYSAPYTLGLKAKVRIIITEAYLKKLDIKMVKADYLQSFQGSWSIEASPDKSKKLLLIHEINIDPKIGFAKDLFFQFYKEGLKDTMTRLKKEIESPT